MFDNTLGNKAYGVSHGKHIAESAGVCSRSSLNVNIAKSTPTIALASEISSKT